MAEDLLAEKASKYPLIFIGILLLAIVCLFTLYLQAIGKFDIMVNLSEIWFWVANALITLGIGFLIRGFTGHRRQTERAPAPTPTPNGETVQNVDSKRVTRKGALLTERQHKYRQQVKADLLRIRIQLHDFIIPNPILFKSWNESTEPDFHNLKHQLIGVKEQDEAIERFSTALNKRNDDRYTPKFQELNEECVGLFNGIRKTGFLDADSSEPRSERLPQSFVISTAQEPENIRMREIHVQLPSGEILKREASFYIVSVGVPVASENAQEFKLLLRNPYTADNDELWNISSTGVPHILVPWTFREKSRPETCDDFAAALLEAKIRHFTLTAGADHLNLVSFVFFFTIHGCEAIYFPTHNHRKADMHTRFQTELYAEANNRSQTLLKRFEIYGQRWDTVSVTELRNIP